jgi:hypothetical protein
MGSDILERRTRLSQYTNVGRATYSGGIRSLKNASVSASDAGGSRGASCIVGVSTSAKCGVHSWYCVSTFRPGPRNVDRSGAEDDCGVDASVGV